MVLYNYHDNYYRGNYHLTLMHELVQKFFIAIIIIAATYSSRREKPAMTSHVPLDGQLCFSLYATSMAINRAYKPLLDAMGITYPQYLVLSVLAENGEQTISAIAERLDLEPSTITPLVREA